MKQNELILDKHLTCREPACKFHIFCGQPDQYHAHFILNGLEFVAHIEPHKAKPDCFAIKILNPRGDLVAQGGFPAGKDITHYNMSKYLKKSREAIMKAYTMITPATNKILA